MAPIEKIVTTMAVQSLMSHPVRSDLYLCKDQHIVLLLIWVNIIVGHHILLTTRLYHQAMSLLRLLPALCQLAEKMQLLHPLTCAIQMTC
jgi:hypothetical protein